MSHLHFLYLRLRRQFPLDSEIRLHLQGLRRLKPQTRNVHLNVMLIALHYMSIMTQQWWSSHYTHSSHYTLLGRHSPGISGNSLDVLLRLLSALVTPEIKATLRYITVASRENTPFGSMIFPAINLHLV